MYIFLGIDGEIASIIGSSIISVKSITDPILNLQKKGYKLDPGAMQRFKEKGENEKAEMTNFQKAKSIITFLLPGINLLSATVNYYVIKKQFETDPKLTCAITKMTDKEKELYSQLENNFQRIGFFATKSLEEDNERELFGFAGNRPIVVDHGLSSLYSDELEPIGYTLDDVKRLNDVYGYSYRIGTIDGKNVAVIGIPNPNSPFSRVSFRNDKPNKHHDYVKMTEEEAQDKSFAVYDFYENKKEEINKVIDEIKKERIEEFDRTMNVEAQLNPTEISKTEDKGPVLKKN